MDPSAPLPESLRNIAPKRLIPLLLALCIFVVTGRSAERVSPSWLRRLVPARQLWHPVSANTLMDVGLPRLGYGVYWILGDERSTAIAWTSRVRVGCEGDRPFFQVCVRLSYRWWSMAVLALLSHDESEMLRAPKCSVAS